VIQDRRQQESDLLLVDTGNFVKGKGSANLLKAQYLAKAMSRMDYNVVNLGREEIMLGAEELLSLRELERLPLLSSNVLRRDRGRHLVLPYVIERVGASSFLGFRYGGIRVALVGVALSGENDPMRRMIPPDLKVMPAAEALDAALEKLRDRCDVIVVLSDLDLETAKKLARQVEGVDLFFIGAGARNKYFEQIDGTIFVYPAKKGDELGQIELLLDEDREVTSFDVEWTLLDTSITDDPEMTRLIESYKEERKQLHQRPPGIQH
jgi:2',3'-cyclic-nucleotide 2'-phosphodiesterase (5'-nucleotidase family)